MVLNFYLFISLGQVTAERHSIQKSSQSWSFQQSQESYFRDMLSYIGALKWLQESILEWPLRKPFWVWESALCHQASKYPPAITLHSLTLRRREKLVTELGPVSVSPKLGRSPSTVMNTQEYMWLFLWDSGGSDGKESACSAGDMGSIPGSGRSPGEGNGYPLQYSCLKNFMNRGAWQAV